MSKEVIENGKKYVLAYSSDPKKRKRVVVSNIKDIPTDRAVASLEARGRIQNEKASNPK